MSTALSLCQKHPQAPVLSEILEHMVEKRKSGKKRITDEEREAANNGFEEYAKNSNKWMMDELPPPRAFLEFNLPRGVSKVSFYTILGSYTTLNLAYRVTSSAAMSH